jgi:FkbM family methyltransferase
MDNLILNEEGKPINTFTIEKTEQEYANKYIDSNDVVLELGARYGSVSVVINKKLCDPTKQMVVEPDERVWKALTENRNRHNCKFHIIEGFISKNKHTLTNLQDCLNGYASTAIPAETSTIPSYDLEELQKKHQMKFNVLVADCEGFLETFFEQYPFLYDQLRLIMFEADYPEKCDYAKIKLTLRSKGFRPLHEGYQQVWRR